MYSQQDAAYTGARGRSRWVFGALVILAALLGRPVLPTLHAHEHVTCHSAHAHHAHHHGEGEHRHDHNDQSPLDNPDAPAHDPTHGSSCSICDELFRAKSVAVSAAQILVQSGVVCERHRTPPTQPIPQAPYVQSARPRGPPHPIAGVNLVRAG